MPKISKNLWRMADAMYEIYKVLPAALKTELPKVENSKKTGARTIARKWLTEVHKKGLDEIPKSHNHNVNAFYAAFGCSALKRYEKLSPGCLDSIGATIGKYHRNLWLYLAQKGIE